MARTPTLLRTAVVVLASGLCLSACGGNSPGVGLATGGPSVTSTGSTTSAATYAGDPCQVLTTADFAAAGLRLVKAEKQMSNSCMYDVGAGGFMSLFVDSPSGYATNRSGYSSTTVVSGIGDEAYQATGPGGDHTWGSLAGATAIRVGAGYATTDQQYQLLLKAAVTYVASH